MKKNLYLFYDNYFQLLSLVFSIVSIFIISIMVNNTDITSVFIFFQKYVHCKNIQAVSTNYYLVTSSTEFLHSISDFKVLSELLFFSWPNL